MATLHDVARAAGVSVSAVSRVLSNSPTVRVSDATRARIHDAARELEYRPNHAGRALKLARSNVLALVVPDLTNAVFTELMEGVEDAALDRDYFVLLGRSERMQPGGGTIERLVGEGRVDAVLIQPGEGLPLTPELLHAQKAPVVLLNSVDEALEGAVTAPDAEAARLAVAHLVARGHRRIALAGGVRASATARRREAGYRAGLAAAGIEVDERLVLHGGYSPSAGGGALRALRESGERPTAVVFANVNAAIGGLAWARRHGVSIPADLSVVAIHDSWSAENTSPPLTTVRLPLRELGRTAVDRAVRRLRGDREAAAPVVVDAAPVLVERDSVSPAP